MLARDSFSLDCLGGGLLAGDNWVRVLYLDEAGIGKLKNDPVLVVAGVLINADAQWAAISNRLKSALLDATPKGLKVPEFLHAKDIYHGTRDFDRQLWPREVRAALLEDLARIPAEFDIPIVWMAEHRDKYAKDNPNDSPQDHVRDCYSACTLGCLMQAEMYMRDLPNQGEVASVILEENKDIQKRMPELLKFINNPGDGQGLDPFWRECMPLSKLIDTPACQPKTASNILQLADFCAFALKRRLQGDIGANRWMEHLAAQFLIIKPADLSNNGRWNPRFMPKKWGNLVGFKDGQFFLKG